MNVRPTSWLVALALLSAGCTLVSDGAHVISYRTRRALDDSREWHRDRRLADAAWDEVGGRTPGLSVDYSDGFKEGFAAHLFRGTCEPPPLPPSKYRTVRNQNSAGYQAAENWLNGFRRGVTEAQSRGLRDLVTGPSAFRTAAPETGPTTPDPLLLPPPPEPVAPATAVVPAAATAPAATARAASPLLLPDSAPLRVPPPVKTLPEAVGDAPPRDTFVPAPPRRVTMQQIIQTRLAVATPTAGQPADRPTAIEPVPPSPQRTDEPTPHWSKSTAPDPVNIWWRSDG